MNAKREKGQKRYVTEMLPKEWLSDNQAFFFENGNELSFLYSNSAILVPEQ